VRLDTRLTAAYAPLALATADYATVRFEYGSRWRLYNCLPCLTTDFYVCGHLQHRVLSAGAVLLVQVTTT
jgi:hypothetical protein